MSAKQSACSEWGKGRGQGEEGDGGWRPQCQPGPCPSSPITATLQWRWWWAQAATPALHYPLAWRCSPQPPSLPVVGALLKPIHLLLTGPRCLNDAAPVEICHPFSWWYFEMCMHLLCSWNQIGIDVFIRTASINMMPFLVNYSAW